MTQADLVRLLFAKGDEGFSWKYGKCEHFMQIHLVKMAYGLEKMLDELRKKDVKVFKSSMISYFGSRTSYYRYKLGQTRIIPEQQQYILQWCKDQGYENMVFDRYTEELDY